MIIRKYKANEESIKCQVCFNDFRNDETYVQCKNCEMQFCKECLKDSMINYNSAFSFSGNIFNLHCPNCKDIIEINTITELFGKNFYYKELIPKMTNVKSKYLLTEKIKDLSFFMSKYLVTSNKSMLDELYDVLMKYPDLSYEVGGKKIKYISLAGKSFSRIFEDYIELKTGKNCNFYMYLLLTFIKNIDEFSELSIRPYFVFNINTSKHIRLLENIKPNEPQTLIDYILKHDGTFEEYMFDEKNESKLIDFIVKQYPNSEESEILKIFSQLYSYKNIAPLKCYINKYYEEIYLLLYVSLYKTYIKKRTDCLYVYRSTLRKYLNEINSTNQTKKEFRVEFKCPSCEVGFLDEFYICNCCKNKFCRDCLIVLDENHKCKPADKATLKMITQLERLRPDIVHLHNIHSHEVNLSLLFKYLKNFRL